MRQANLLTAGKLECSFGKVPVLRSVSLAVAPGSIYALLAALGRRVEKMELQ